MTRFRLFILLTYTAVLTYSESAPIQRCAALSPLLPTKNQFFTARTHSAYEGDDGYQPASSFVNSSRERSLSSTLPYPSLRCNLHLFTLSPIPCRGRDQRDAGSRAHTHTHISDGTIYGRRTILFGRFCWFSYPSSFTSSRLTFFVVFP